MKVHQAVGHTESDSLLRTIDRDLAEGRIDRGFHNTLRTRLLRVNDDPTIPDEEKSARRTELLNRFREIGGRLNKKKTDPKKPLKEGKKGELQEFRDFVLESAPYISGEDERKFLRYTQKAFDDSQIAKIGIFESLRQRLTFLPGMTAEEEAETLTGAMDKILDPKVSVQEATVAADGLAEQKVVAKNPNRAAYQVGQTITVNGAAYKVTGFDTDGEPLVEPI